MIRRKQLHAQSIALLSLSAALAVGGDTSGRQEPGLPEVLARAARQTADIHHQMSNLVAEEVYEQQVRVPANQLASPRDLSRRVLKSDLLLVAPDGERYVEFRDVFEVDGVPVRDRDERLATLFLAPSPSSRQRLETIIKESARYNVGDVPRNINTPMLALSFLLPGSQPRFRFRKAGPRTPQLTELLSADATSGPVFRVSTTMWTVEFHEMRRPTAIRTDGGRDFPARGRFWIEPDTGAVRISELEMDNGSVGATINVSFRPEPSLGSLVPVEMRERYQAASGGIEGVARYRRFRQFKVGTTELLSRPPGPLK